MKIVNVYNGDFIHSSQGGGMRYLRDLMQAQHRKGYAVELLAVGTGAPRQIDIEGVPVTYVPVSPTLRWPVFLLNLFLYLIKNGKQYYNQTIHLHRVYFAPVFRLLVRKAHIVVTIHSKTFAVITERYPSLEKILPLMLSGEKLLLKTCINGISAAGDYAIDLYHERHDLQQGAIIPLRCPSLMRPSEIKHSMLAADSRKNILCVGRIAAVKRPLSVLELFYRAAQSRPELTATHRLVYVGDGEDRSTLEKQVVQLGMINAVTVLGSIPANEMPDIYAAGFCLVLLSSSEVAPFTVKEALTAGLPVFATDVGIVSEYVPNSCGKIIPATNPETQSDMFLEFLDHNYSNDDCKMYAKLIRNKEQEQFEAGLQTLYR